MSGEPTSATTEGLTIRRARGRDLPEIISVCAEALGWDPEDENRDFFTWKHIDNPFGPSPIWIAVEASDQGERIVGVRALMRWELTSASGHWRLARAVDTATLPSHQGRGLFTRLTTMAVDELGQEDTHAIFNTPNDKSRPGYLKMGWVSLGSVPVRAHPRDLSSIFALRTARQAAEKWGVPVDAGIDPDIALADTDLLDDLVNRMPTTQGWSTPLSPAYLRWRCGFQPLHCRIAPIDGSLESGFVVFRVRRRGELRQLSVLEVVKPAGGRSALRAVRRLLDETDSHIALSAGAGARSLDGMVPAPRLGPVLTWREIAGSAVPELDDLALSLGTVELF